MATVQSNLSANQPNQSPIELADSAQRRIFLLSVIFGLVAAFIAALLAWQVWKTNNTYQAAVKSDADARIEEAKGQASKADERASKADEGASLANERAEKLENDNLTLRSQVATLEKQAADASKEVAGLQKAAADAKAAQQRVEIDLSAQLARTARLEKEAADAKRAYLELQERIKGRHLTPAQSAQLLERFNKIPVKGLVVIWCFESISDSCAFAEEFQAVFKKANWPHGFVRVDSTSFVPPVGLLLAVQDANNVPAHTEYLGQALASIGFDVLGVSATSFTDKRPPNTVSLVIGSKP